MPKAKNMNKGKGKGKGKLDSIEASRNNPSDSCKDFVIKCIVAFYEAETTLSLESKYIRYGEECIEKFKQDMNDRLLQALHVPQWHAEMDKPNFTHWLNQRVHDGLWNGKAIMEKFGKANRPHDEAFEDVIVRVDMFMKRCKAYTSKHNRDGLVGWWRTPAGIAEVSSARRHLIALPETARVISVDNKTRRGGYATIRRVRIEGCAEIPAFWEFAAKMSLQEGRRPELAKMEHNTESMAVRIQHDGVIRFMAVHATKNEGYAYWWNGGTLREMLNLDRKYSEDIYIRVAYTSGISDEEVLAAKNLKKFRAKRTELAWAFLHIMNAVHSAGHLHNDISPDNIMFHFPEDESKVYIGVADWGMTTVSNASVKSLYTFTSVAERKEALTRRWWVDPNIAYLHTKDADVENIPTLSKTSEEFAIGKLAQAINGNNMSGAYHMLQSREGAGLTVRFAPHELGETFELYLRQLCGDTSAGKYTLSHVVMRFTSWFHWPVPDEYFRRSYV